MRFLSLAPSAFGGPCLRIAPALAPILALAVTLFLGGTAAAAQGFGESRLPILEIAIAAEDIPDEPKALSTMRLVYEEGRATNAVGGPTRDYVGAVAIEQRGSSSRDLFPKVGYKLELRGADGADTSAALLGMPEEEDWVLHGPYSDKTLLRNAFSYVTARELPGYAPRCRFVELVLGGEYWGVYLLVESVKRDGDRVDVAKLTPADASGDALTGGYILKVDKVTGEDFGLDPAFRLPPRKLRGQAETQLLYHYPKPRNITPEQRRYIRDWMREFEARLAGPDFEDETLGYAPLIDERSFIDYLFVNEVTKNVDAYRLSTYLYKERDSDGGRLHMGPVWDYNLALANADYGGGDVVENWAFDFDRYRPEDFFQAPFWYTRLWSSAGFRQNCARRWTALRTAGEALSDERLYGIYDSLAAKIGGEVAGRNFERWPVLGVYTWPNSFVPATHDLALAHAREYLRQRLAWLDAQFEAVTAAADTALTGGFARVFPNPGPGDAARLAGVPPSAYPVRVTWFDPLGRLMLETSVLRKGDPIRTPPAAGHYLFRVRGVDGADLGGGQWVRLP